MSRKIVEDLKARRMALKISQISLAQLVGVSALTIQLWERGAGAPNDKNGKKLEEVLDELEAKQANQK